MSLAASTAFINPTGLPTATSFLQERCGVAAASEAALKPLQKAGLRAAATFTWSSSAVLLGATVLGAACRKCRTKHRRLASAAADGSISTAKPFDPTNADGVQAPLGYWDPCGLMKERVGRDGWQWKDEATFEKYRAMELKHGRLAMLAATGMITTAFIKFKGDIFQYSPEGFAVFQSPAAAGIGVIFIMVGGFELNTPKGDYKDPLGLAWSAKWAEQSWLRTAEQAHGRLGMSVALTFLLYMGGGSYPSDVLRFELAAANKPIALIVLGALWLAWTNPKGMDSSAPEVYPWYLSPATPVSALPSGNISVKASLPAGSSPVAERVKVASKDS